MRIMCVYITKQYNSFKTKYRFESIKGINISEVFIITFELIFFFFIFEE